MDGAIGTELAARGVVFGGADWSARAIWEAPEVLEAVHASYAEAGATLHTANTFRTQPHLLGDRWKHELRAAVERARGAVPEGHRVLGSIAPIEDCYQPDASPGADAEPLHARTALELADAGCDVLLCETFAHEEEALGALRGAARTGLPVWLSLTAGPHGELLSPADVHRIGRRAADEGVTRILANCIGASLMTPYVEALATLGVPVGVYANAGAAEDRLGWKHASDDAGERYAALAQDWVELGATVVGGCCGTGPRHVRALAARFGSGAGGPLGVGV